MFGRTATYAWSVSSALLVSACGSSTPVEPNANAETALEPLGSLNVLTRAYDNQRSGTNLAETVLNTQNVNSSGFGLLFRVRVDDELYASLLYASGVNVGGVLHNVIYAATVNNTLYAIDADDGRELWSRSYNGSGRATRIQDTAELDGCYNVTNNTGITGTPVIDGATQTLYFAAHTLTDGQQRYVLHAVDIRTGAEKLGGPVTIDASGFDAVYNNQRPGLGLSNGVLYVAFASYCDRGAYNGWVMAFDATTLQRTAALNVTRDGQYGGVWQAGAGPAFDPDGNLYIATGNGSFDGNKQFGMSLLKLAPRSLERLDYFTPSNYASANDRDLDLGSAGPSLVPGQNLLVTGAKDGHVYVLNRDNLGHRADGDSQIPQRLTAVSTAPHPSGTHHIHNGVVLWKSPSGTNMYVWGENDFLRAYRLNASSGKFDTAAVAVGSVLPPEGMPGGMMALSANGSRAGTGILWATTQAVGDANNFTVPGTLSAFDASTLRLLWQSRSAGNDMLSLAKFNAPLIANGKVYVASFSNAISVYGLRNGPPPPIPDATYQLRLGTGDGLCVDVEGASPADAALVQQYTCNGSAAQRWSVRNVADNVYELVSAASGKCLDVGGGSAADGAVIQQYTCNGSAAQHWVVDDLGGGAYRLISQTGSGKCLDVPGASAAVATKLQQYTCNGTAAQTLILALDNDGEAPIPGGTFRIRTGTRSGQCLDAKLVLGNLGELRQLGCNDSAGQRFRFRRFAADEYEIRPAISERCIDVAGGSDADAAGVQQYLCNSSAAQRWKVRGLGAGQYQLLAQTGSERCLDVAGGSDADFVPLQQYACNGTPAQTFSVIAP
ncbi:MAG TPA: RICIN domain-containing protein [Polyangiaceae bacterium]|nr:RICIN domain-containing protein [Polyangiaceae bacterium]